MRHAPLRCCVFRSIHPYSGENRLRSFNESVFDLNAIKLFQHGLGGDEDEDHCGGSVDQIHGKAGNIVGFQHFPIERLGIVHQRSGGIHNATVDDDRRKRAEGG